MSGAARKRTTQEGILLASFDSGVCLQILMETICTCMYITLPHIPDLHSHPVRFLSTVNDIYASNVSLNTQETESESAGLANSEIPACGDPCSIRDPTPAWRSGFPRHASSQTFRGGHHSHPTGSPVKKAGYLQLREIHGADF